MFIVRRLFRLVYLFAKGAPLGDVVVLKFSMFRKPAAYINPKLKRYRGLASSISLAELLRMPPDSFGFQYGKHLAANNIEHLTISPALLKEFEDNPYAVRYTQTHDFHHTLLGFDTSVAGELGVAAFTAEQGLGPLSVRALKILRWIYPVFVPFQCRALQHNLRLGFAMGKKAKLVIQEPLEERLLEPIDSLRLSLGIDPEDTRSAQPGGRSVFVSAIYRVFGRVD